MRPSSARSANTSPDPSDHVESRMLGQRARPVRRAGTGRPTPETAHGASSPTHHMQLDRRGAELLFQVLTEREEKASVAIASNESFGGWTKTFTDPRLCAAIVDSPSAAPSSRPAPTPTVWPKPQGSGQPDTRRARKRCRRKPTSAAPTRARRCQNSPTSGVGRNLRSHRPEERWPRTRCRPVVR
ncbi:ATP-binding protein [Nonomuraea sp. NPDC050556]|uniref:ATP-binding protein n=1 Tax=Nonomuraea sp. NPDC050556 TaxID=3364369 RepID=UPI0037B7E15E